MRKLVLFASVLLLAAAQKPVDVTSKTAHVLDLAVPWTMPMPSGAVAAPTTLSPSDASAILAAPALDMEGTGQLRWIEGRKDSDEKKALAAEKGGVTRNGASLARARRSSSRTGRRPPRRRPTATSSRTRTRGDTGRAASTA